MSVFFIFYSPHYFYDRTYLINSIFCKTLTIANTRTHIEKHNAGFVVVVSPWFFDGIEMARRLVKKRQVREIVPFYFPK